MVEAFEIDPDSMGLITSAVQFGFISGTLAFAILKLSDRFSPSKVFFICAILGSSLNLLSGIAVMSLPSLIVIKIGIGFFLAGIYPVGMKIAADYHEKGLGLALGYLVGALVLGTASPFLLREIFESFPWQWVIYSVSLLSVIGGALIMVGVPDGPYRRPSLTVHFSDFLKVFRNRPFRSAAFGYFGHMWELYAFWAFIPYFLSAFDARSGTMTSEPLTIFAIIAVGSLGCIIGGYFSRKIGSNKVAFWSLVVSGFFCILSPYLLNLPVTIFLSLMMIWGIFVIADSPQFSTLVAQFAPAESRGTALTIVNCIGFAITIISIQLLQNFSGPHMFWILAPGVIFGLVSFSKIHFKNVRES